MKKSIIFIALGVGILLTSCGGGGGFAGAAGANNDLRIEPKVSGFTLPPDSTFLTNLVIIKNGVPPYFIDSTDRSIVTSITSSQNAPVMLQLQSFKPGSATISIQDSSLAQTTIQIPVTVINDLTVSISTPVTLTSGALTGVSFTILNGVAPFSVTSSNQASVTVMAPTGTNPMNNANFNLIPGQTAGTSMISIKDSRGTTFSFAVDVL